MSLYAKQSEAETPSEEIAIAEKYKYIFTYRGTSSGHLRL